MLTISLEREEMLELMVALSTEMEARRGGYSRRPARPLAKVISEIDQQLRLMHGVIFPLGWVVYPLAQWDQRPIP